MQEITVNCVHIGHEEYAHGLCEQCYKHQHYLWNKRKYKRRAARWKRDHPSRTKAIRKKERDRPEQWEERLVWKYGLSKGDYSRILALQGGVCAICKRPPRKRRFAVDHNHKTGEVRGLLCFRCNYGLGWFSDNLEKFKNVVVYLEKGPIKLNIKEANCSK